MLKLPDIKPEGPDNNIPGCFGGKNFLSPRTMLRKDSVMNKLKDKFSIIAGTMTLDSAVGNIDK